MEQLIGHLSIPFRSSLRQRLPFLTSTLFAVILAGFLWVAFLEVQHALVRAGGTRAQSAADQLSTLLTESAQQRTRDVQRVARHPAIRRYLQDQSDDAKGAARVQLTSITTADQPPVELWSVNRQQLLVVSAAPAESITSMSPPRFRGIAAPSAPGVSGFKVSNGIIHWEAIAEVRSDDTASRVAKASRATLLGYVVSRRLLSLASSADGISHLVGPGAVVKIGNQKGDVWTDLTKVVAAPAVDARKGIVEYVVDGQGRLGAGALVVGAPWAVWVEFPRSVIVAPARVFLARMFVFVMLFVFAGALVVHGLSQRITKPLHKLIDAAEALAAGKLHERVVIERPDEIGRLGAAFNEMAEQVREVQQDLEARVEQRTARLAQAEERTKAILKTANDAFVGVNLDGGIVDWNHQAEAMFGWSAEEALGRSLIDTIIPEAHRTADSLGFARYLRTGEGQPLNQRLELVALRQNGDQFPVEITTWASGVDDDQTFHAFVRDITERKRAEQAVSAAKTEAERANRAKNEFLSRMSHDLRTPLNAILGFAQLLESEDLRQDQRDGVQQILRGGKHLLSLINEVLDITRIEAGHLSLSPEPVDVTDVVQHAVDLMASVAADRDLVVSVLDMSSDGAVLADRQRLTQVLLNLLSNAIKYNRPKGRVTVAIEERFDRRIRISVTDTGSGISPEKLQLLFTPFERLGAEASAIEGTGLGLALSRGLAAAMGGSLGVESSVDRGSTFWIELRRADGLSAAPVHDPPSVTSTNAARAAGSVLYIEDNLANVRLMQRVFELRPQVQLRHAPTGADGLAIATEILPDLVLLDLHLPDMYGGEVLRQLQEDPHMRSIPVVVLSADATSEQTRRLTAAGATAYLTKPIEVAGVLRLLDDLLHDTREVRRPIAAR